MLSTHGMVLSDRDRELAVTSASQPSHAANSGTLMSCFPIFIQLENLESITHELNSPTVSTSNLPTLSEGNARAFYSTGVYNLPWLVQLCLQVSKKDWNHSGQSPL